MASLTIQNPAPKQIKALNNIHFAGQANYTRPTASDSFSITFGATQKVATPVTTLPKSNPILDSSLTKAQFLTALGTLNKGRSKGEQLASLSEVLDEFLQNRWTEATQPGKLEATVNELKKLTGARGQGYTVMAQINVTPGDIAGNAKKIIRYIDIAEAIGVDTIVFPELSLMGYPIFDVITRHPDMVDENVLWLKEIAKRTGQTRVLLGFVEPRHDEDGLKRVGKPFFNTMAIMAEGKIEGLVRKSLLPTYGEFNDYRNFEFSSTSGVQDPKTLGHHAVSVDSPKPTEQGKPMTIHGKSYGLSICEDIWNRKTFFEDLLYQRDPIDELLQHNPDLLVNTSSSPTRYRKEQMKHNMLSHVASESGKPLVYLNQVGGIDELSFDGTSRVYNSKGNLVARSKAFQEQFLVVNPLKEEGHIYPLPTGLETTLTALKQFDPTEQADMDRTYQSVVQGIRDYFKKTGFQKAILGLSGGLDSSVVAVLLADALGAENVVGVSMPSKITPGENKGDAETLAKNLGIHFVEIPIVDQVNATESFAQMFDKALSKDLDGPNPRSTRRDNIQAMIRAMNMRGAGNDYKLLPIATSDKSELYMGYATVNGDMSGALAPIGDLVKTKVRNLAGWLNENRAVKGAIPQTVIDKPSGADLKVNPTTGKLVTAEEDLMPYPFLDEVIWNVEFMNLNFDEMKHRPFWYEKQLVHEGLLSTAEQKAEWQEQKEAWILKFYRLMSSAIFKWQVAPPVLIVDGYGVTAAEYNQPIVAKVSPKKPDTSAIAEALEQARITIPAVATKP